MLSDTNGVHGVLTVAGKIIIMRGAVLHYSNRSHRLTLVAVLLQQKANISLVFFFVFAARSCYQVISINSASGAMHQTLLRAGGCCHFQSLSEIATCLAVSGKNKTNTHKKTAGVEKQKLNTGLPSFIGAKRKK